MTNISRRHLFKTATAAGLAVGIPSTQKAQAQASDIRKIPREFTAGLQSKMVYEPVPAAGIDLNTTGTFEQAASILNEGESINASHWGIMRSFKAAALLVSNLLSLTMRRALFWRALPNCLIQRLAFTIRWFVKATSKMVRLLANAAAKTALCVFLGRRLSISPLRKFNVCMTPMVRRASMGALTAGSPLASSIKPRLSSIVCSI